MTTKELTKEDFFYELPADRIAQRPTEKRTESKLLHVGADGSWDDLTFPQIKNLLKKDDLLIFNDTRVIKARLFGQKSTGGKIECLIERVIAPKCAIVHLRFSKRPQSGSQLFFNEGITATVIDQSVDEFTLEFSEPVMDVLDHIGQLPLPPYIKHNPDDFDYERYQTVYAKSEGAIAAPTAGLHFDNNLINELTDMGIQKSMVTLHVGSGTFKPVVTSNLKDHIMHSEWFEVTEETCESISRCRRNGGRVIAVGTTSVRAIESAATLAGLSEKGVPLPYTGDTKLFITPGYKPLVIDGMITNFHLPESTLLMLVASWMGFETMHKIYKHAVEANYRFFSYGDAMYIEPKS
ncbi:tRNA preQ1(34) S-adenosylmethionine ribosyltransferase-isomerase QueA [Taylorella equigenitalis]|uniref:S-adenosylmethionine:tRNA ribosyltransferase-isomerase n=3 Tax=Taylorella equigenitalis TaxID=29575 RepID=A0A654KFZ0_TAYEM|nr:tRNA preQ1(34) S-adenosylmethionine ribosyltransferase-isomerase QueA [Taylorella equigenitalis]ADU91309.1 S-adenosylmethionine:tRNA ribosyltransferase-isomerase [Taylorella equigenitalis MCE9]AFN36404.1 S-adenosylmethionine:tRNA ribosyltransferase-isomerase [Taylorella equigenitalis ATCC 35865]ASY30973.1 tRNA preQ1(34) S-adenosylmethionine ribosyltransferase-isomerase QueA [Taylorella equigenitalis]ASY38277.1 tRNA preQ1(34) S-adenosylmethionine ribosyltransferase-isomerase QueA [Taylorella 